MKPACLALLPLAALAACTPPAPAAAPAPIEAIPLPPPTVAATLDAPSAPLADAGTPPAAPGAGVVTAAGVSPTAPPDASSATVSPSACNEQPPQDFLVRHNFLRERDGNRRAIEYRNLTYGVYQAPGQPPTKARPPSDSVTTTTFMGLPVRMHRKVIPALKCAEEEIKRSCADQPYTARALAGLRARNTYRGGEVTNHIYGIAIDVDPDRNTCCGCVKPWNQAPRCQRPAKTEYERMEMPECWVHAFERYGFYWLGHDVLQDTMHFEFLGDPDRIEKVATPRSP
jgi:hypothetical protein